jgi:hypothetical protein
LHVYTWEKVVPLSWWITNHVEEGRNALDFSEWNRGGRGETDAIVEVVRDSSMPPGYYHWFGMHSSSKLTPAQRRQLADGLAGTIAQSK